MGEYRLKMPDVGEGVVEAEIVEWKIAVGDTVEEDQDVVDVMTDKATVEIPAPISGVVTARVGEPGDMIAVGAEILVISSDADAPVEAPAAAAPAPVEAIEPMPGARAPAPIDPKPAPAARGDQAPVAAPTRGDGRALASPAVRRRALELDVDLAGVPGSGPAGRVSHQDLDDFIAAGGRLASRAAPRAAGRVRRAGVRETKIIGLRRKIAENLAQAAASIPHITYVEEVDVTALEALRAQLNRDRREGQPKLTFLPFLATAMARALPDVPQANAHYDADAGVLTEHDGVHIGIAAATEAGLVVPVVRHAEARGLWDLADEIKRLSEAARDGTCPREELTGSTITITSLGAIGGIVTTPIINAPETAIIGVNKITERPAFDEAGRVIPRRFMNLSSSFDHRIVDGFEAATLVQRLKALLETPATLFID